MIVDNIFDLCVIIGVVYSIVGVISIKIFDKLTRYKDDDITLLSNEHYHKFFWLNILCVFLLNKIKKERRIKYHERRLLYSKLRYERLLDIMDDVKSEDLKDAKDRIQIMTRLLKIEKLKSKI